MRDSLMQMRLAQLTNLPVDQYGRIYGSNIVPHSIPPDRMAVQHLSDISDSAGFLHGGSLLAGPQHGAHIAFGDLWNGLEVTFDDGRPWFTLNKLTRSGRFGAPGSAGVDITEGLLHAHGDMIVDHTITAAKLIAGEIFTHFMTADNIQVGFTDEVTGLFTGVRLGAGGLGGYSDDQLRAGFDTGSGIFETRGFGELEALYDSVRIFDAGIEISGMGDRDPLTFKLWSQVEGSANYGITRHIGMDVDGAGFVLYNVESTIPPRIALADTDKEIISAYLGVGGLAIWDLEHTQSVVLSVDAGGVTLQSFNANSLFIANGDSGFEVTPEVVNLISPLRPGMFATTPASPGDGELWYNATTHVWQFYNGSAWQKFSYTAV